MFNELRDRSCLFVFDLHCFHFHFIILHVILATGWWFFPGPTVSFTNKTDRHDITEILLKGVLNTIKQTNKHKFNRNSTHLT